jgi:hypothetical protein
MSAEIPDYMLEWLKKRCPGRRITTEMLMDASGVPRQDWGGELIAALPRQMQRHAERIAEQARREAEQEEEEERQEAERQAAKALGQQDFGSMPGWIN